MAVALALRERGHTAAFYTGERYRAAVEREGFECLPFDLVEARLRMFVQPSIRRDGQDVYELLLERYSGVGISSPLARWSLTRRMLREMVVGTIPEQVTGLEAIRKTWRPDVLVTDAMFWGPIAVAHEKIRLPVAVLCFYAGCLIPEKGAAPPGFGLPGPGTWRTWLFNRCAQAVIRLMTADLRRQVDNSRAKFGLPPARRPVSELAGRMPLYLVTSTPELDGKRTDLPESVRYVGPCCWDRPAGVEMPEWLESTGSGAPLVYVSEGTSQVRDPALLRCAIEALADCPVQVVLTTGKHRCPADLGPAPANMRFEQFVPHSQLIPNASVVVTNGGSNGVRDALRFGVPLVVSPMEWDQLENAKRVAESGAGLRIAPAQCTPQALRTAVETLLRCERYRKAAARIADSFRQAGQAAEAARLLEQLNAQPK
jgi:UDP:flavonoid glycosyltransferase YjiC (YdhE family)